MNALATYLAEKNATTRAWVAEAPDSRWASLLTEDLAHWQGYGVTNPEQLDIYLLACDVYETTKSVYGYRTNWNVLVGMSVEALRAEMVLLSKASREQMAWEEECERAEAEQAKREEEEHNRATARALTREEWTFGTALAMAGL